jgi:hypothetical protein
MASKAPAAFDTTGVGTVLSSEPLHVSVIVLDGSNPCPVMSNEDRGVPLLDESVIFLKAVKVAVAAPPTLSVARTVLAPGVAVGTLKTAVKLPWGLVSMVVGVVATISELNVTVMRLAGPKPAPVKRMLSPMLPLVGLSFMEAETVYDDDNLFPVESLATIVWTCPVDSGMGKLTSNLPLVSANIVDGVVVSVWASKVRVTWDPAANPAPFVVTTVPTVPVVDERVSFVVIVYVATLCRPFESWARTLQPPVGLFGAAKEAVKAPY